MTAASNNLQRRRVLCQGAALAAALAPLPLRAQSKPTKLTLGYTAVSDFGMAFVAKERGLFEKHGLDVTLQLIALTSNVPATMVSDSVQIGGVTPPVFLQAIDSGIDLVALAGGSTYVNAMKMIGVVARNGSGIATVQDFVGRKVGVPGLNGNLHLLVRRWLARSGVDPKRVTFIEVSLPNMPTVLTRGNVDAVVTVEPFIARLVQGGGVTVVPGFTQGLPDGWAVVHYAATRNWAIANSRAVQSFRAALADAVAFTRANETAARDDIGKYFKVPPAILQATPFPHFDPTLTQDQLRFWSDTMREQEMLTKHPLLGSLMLR